MNFCHPIPPPHSWSFFYIIYTFLGSIIEPDYIQNRVIMNHVIKRLMGITLFQLTLWDTGGMERMSFIGQSYYRGANAALLCYSINKKETFSILSQYILDIVMNAEGAKIFLCGNFADNDEGEGDCVNEMDIENFTRDCGNVLSGSYQVSCKDNVGVQEMFSDMAKVMHQDSVNRMTLQRDFVIKPGETPEDESLHKRKCCTS